MQVIPIQKSKKVYIKFEKIGFIQPQHFNVLFVLQL